MTYPVFHPESDIPAPLFMSAGDFSAAFPAESEYVERKRGFAHAAVQESAVAFANADGGVILLGVDDSGAVVGRPRAPGLVDDIHQAMRDARDPGRYAIHELRVDGVSVVVVSVARRVAGFAQTSNGRVLVRKGTMRVPLFGADLARFINARSLARFEETDSGVGLDDAAGDEVAHLAAGFGWSHDVPARLVDHGLLLPGPDRRLTIAGALHLLADPAERLGKTFVEILRLPETGTEYERRIDVRGPLRRQVEGTVDELVRELGTELVVLGVRRYELPRIPQVVLREAVANAVAHRSYEMTGTAIRVEIRPQSVRIVSPGGLPEPVTVDNIRETQSARNVRVISVLRRLGLAEDVGRGVDVMVDSMVDEMLDPPVFDDSGHAVAVVLPIRSAVTPSERAWVREMEARGLTRPLDRILLVHAARGERLTNGRARQLTEMDAGEARGTLQRLRDAGFLVQQGSRGGATYTLTESLGPPAGLRLSKNALKALVLELANTDDPPLTNARVRERTGLDRIEALRLLDELVRDGALERTGTRRGTKYLRARGFVDRPPRA